MNVIHNVRRYHRRVSALRAGELVIRRKRHSTGGILPQGVPGLQIEPTQRAVRAAEARVALSTGQLRPQLQPIVAVPSGALEGFELLARWRRPGAYRRDRVGDFRQGVRHRASGSRARYGERRTMVERHRRRLAGLSRTRFGGRHAGLALRSRHGGLNDAVV